MATTDGKWFTNRGQILQVLIQLIALVIVARNAWNDLMSSRFFSSGAVLFYVLAGLVFLSWWKKEAAGIFAKNQKRPLQIYSAVYGTDPQNGMDVTETLQRLSKGEALVIQVENDQFGPDPVPNRPKRIEVEYSYGNPHRSKISRPEHARLILPEDPWLKQRSEQLTTIEKELRDAWTRIDELAAQSNQSAAKVRELEEELANLRKKLSPADNK